MADSSKSVDAQVGGNQVDTLREFAEFCHDYYAGTHKETPWGEWRYAYHHQVDIMLELFLQRERIVDAVVTDLKLSDSSAMSGESNPQSNGGG